MNNNFIYACFTFLLMAKPIAAIPEADRFVSADNGVPIVSWRHFSDGFIVYLEKDNLVDSDSILMSGAQCRDIEAGYRCYIKPYRRAGILTTDIFFNRMAVRLFEISTLVLIDGSFTAKHLIGKNFTEHGSKY